MGLFKKISDFKYERRKRKQEKELEKYNHRQEKYDNIYKNEKQKSDFKSLLSNLKFETYTKRLVGIIVFVGLVDLQLSYILAFMDKMQIAESLSNQICVTIVGTALVYMIKSYLETKAEKRDEMIKAGLIVDKNSTIISDEVLKTKVLEIINNSGLAEHINAENTPTMVPAPENPDDGKSFG